MQVNDVGPGPVDTPLLPAFREQTGAEQMDWLNAQVGRVGSPDDIAEVLTWLAIGEHRWLNGNHITVDGGLSAGMWPAGWTSFLARRAGLSSTTDATEVRWRRERAGRRPGRRRRALSAVSVAPAMVGAVAPAGCAGATAGRRQIAGPATAPTAAPLTAPVLGGPVTATCGFRRPPRWLPLAGERRPCCR